MITVLKNWSMIYLFGYLDGSGMHQRWGRVVTGEVVLDGQGETQPGSKICSTAILRSPGNMVQTRDGRTYSLFGKGQTFEFPVSMLPQLQQLEDPASLKETLDSDWKQK